MDLEELKKKFRHKSEVDVKDINIALKAVPFLVKEVLRLEEELDSRDKFIERLKRKIKRQPDMTQKGEKDGLKWVLKADEESNIIIARVTGVPCKTGFKIFTNSIINIAENLGSDFCVVNDFIELEFEKITKRIFFYFRKTYYLFLKMGVKYIIFVVPHEKKDISVITKSKFSKNNGKNIFIATSMDEAKNIIKNAGKHIRS